MNYPLLEFPAGIRLCFSLGQDWLDFVAGALLSAHHAGLERTNPCSVRLGHIPKLAWQFGVTVALPLCQLTGLLLCLFPVHSSAGIAPGLK